VQNFSGIIGAVGTNLSWTVPIANGSNITAYVLERSDAFEGTNGENIWRVVVSTLSTSYLVPEPNPCHSSTYRIRSYDGSQYSDYSPTLASNNASRCSKVLGLISLTTPIPNTGGFSLQINDFDDVNYTWNTYLPSGLVSISKTGLITGSQMSANVKKRLYVFKINKTTGEYVGINVQEVTSGN